METRTPQIRPSRRLQRLGLAAPFLAVFFGLQSLRVGLAFSVSGVSWSSKLVGGLGCGEGTKNATFLRADSSFSRPSPTCALRAELKGSSSATPPSPPPSPAEESPLEQVFRLRERKFFVYDNEEEPWKPNVKLGVRAPMPVPPKGSVVLPEFEFPQFLDLRSSILYRRRLRRRRRYNGWQFQDMAPYRKFFGARRNHRDQMMHALLSRQSAEARRCAGAWNARSWLASRRLFGKVGQGERRETFEEETKEASSAAHFLEATKASPLPISVEAARSFLRRIPPFEQLEPLPLRDLECIYTALRSAFVTLLLATAPPAVLARELAEGFRLPPTCAATKTDPFMSVPDKNTHAWKGYRRWRLMKSRRFDWQKATRLVPPCIAGVSLPRIGSDLLLLIWKRRKHQLRDAFLALQKGPGEKRESAKAAEKSLNFALEAPPPAVPPWLESEETRVRELLVPVRDGVNRSVSATEKAKAENPLQTANSEAALENAGFVRRALSAAVDVRLWLRCAKATKKKGHRSAYTWDSPFVKARDASPRRRRRLEALPPPGQRQKTRRERLAVKLQKRLERKREKQEKEATSRQAREAAAAQGVEQPASKSDGLSVHPKRRTPQLLKQRAASAEA